MFQTLSHNIHLEILKYISSLELFQTIRLVNSTGYQLSTAPKINRFICGYWTPVPKLEHIINSFQLMQGARAQFLIAFPSRTRHILDFRIIYIIYIYINIYIYIEGKEVCSAYIGDKGDVERNRRFMLTFSNVLRDNITIEQLNLCTFEYIF